MLQWVLDLRREIGIPHTLKELGVDNERIDELARLAAVDPTAGGNPIPIGIPELKTMFVAAIEGRMGKPN